MRYTISVYVVDGHDELHASFGNYCSSAELAHACARNLAKHIARCYLEADAQIVNCDSADKLDAFNVAQQQSDVLYVNDVVGMYSVLETFTVCVETLTESAAAHGYVGHKARIADLLDADSYGAIFAQVTKA